MGATGTPFARNVEFEATFPELGATALARNRHGDRLGLLKPDPQVISRQLFTRAHRSRDTCHEGRGPAGRLGRRPLRLQEGAVPQRAGRVLDPVHDPRLVLASRGRPQRSRADGHGLRDASGSTASSGRSRPRRPRALGCRPGTGSTGYGRRERRTRRPSTHGGRTHLTRAYQTTRNTVTAWWDASQLYGYDATSRAARPARSGRSAPSCLLVPDRPRWRRRRRWATCPCFEAADPINPAVGRPGGGRRSRTTGRSA